MGSGKLQAGLAGPHSLAGFCRDSVTTPYLGFGLAFVPPWEAPHGCRSPDLQGLQPQ